MLFVTLFCMHPRLKYYDGVNVSFYKYTKILHLSLFVSVNTAQRADLQSRVTNEIKPYLRNFVRPFQIHHYNVLA